MYIMYITIELNVSQQEIGKKCFMFSLLVDNSYDSFQHMIQYVFLIVVRCLHTGPVATAHTSQPPQVTYYPPANVNTSYQTSALCCW